MVPPLVLAGAQLVDRTAANVYHLTSRCAGQLSLIKDAIVIQIIIDLEQEGPPYAVMRSVPDDLAGIIDSPRFSKHPA